MATYWFRNTGNTSWTVATNWSLTDGGGATGAVPTAADNAYFSNLSGNCLVPSPGNVSNIDFTQGTGFTGSFTFSSFSLTVTTGGSIKLNPNMVCISPNVGGFTVTNCTINFNGNQSNVVLLINGNGVITLQSNLRLKSLKEQTNSTTVTFSGNYNIITDEFINTSYAHTTNLSGDLTINNNFNIVTSTSANKNIIKSSLAGTKRNIIVGNEASQDLGFVNFTDISAIGGQTIFTYKGVITNCDNVQQLTQAISQISKGEIM